MSGWHSPLIVPAQVPTWFTTAQLNCNVSVEASEMARVLAALLVFGAQNGKS